MNDDKPRGVGEPESEPVIRTVAMPADANPRGDIFGGWLLSQMDLAAGNAASTRARGRVATVALDSMSFHLPVFIGDLVSCYAHVIRVGRTSLGIHVETWVQRADTDDRIKVTEGIFTFVALDGEGRPRPVSSAS